MAPLEEQDLASPRRMSSPKDCRCLPALYLGDISTGAIGRGGCARL